MCVCEYACVCVCVCVCMLTFHCVPINHIMVDRPKMF